MAKVFKRRVGAGALLAAALAGGAAGAAIYAATASPRTTVVRTARSEATPIARTVASQLSVKEIYTQSAGGVVEVDVTTASSGDSPFGGGSSSQEAQGTGFVYDTKGHIVTNEHVIENADSITVTFADGSTYKATLVGRDASTDLAVLKIDASASRLHPLTLGDSSPVGVGDGVVAIGDPFGLDGTVTAGIVSAVGREITSPDNSPIENAIQTDAPINHGNSGGPLFDMRGRVIGVTAQIESTSGGSDGVGFAIPSDTVKSVVAQLIASGTATHALLGVDVQTLPGNVAATLGVPTGVAVVSIQSGSAAAKAGLRASTGTRTIAGQRYPTGSDVITAFDGTRVKTAQELRGLIGAVRPGQSVALTVVRRGKTRSVSVVLGARS